jgi:hypothetical protein
MTRPEQDDPANLGDTLSWAARIVVCAALVAVVILGLAIGLVVCGFPQASRSPGTVRPPPRPAAVEDGPGQTVVWRVAG